MKKITHKEIAKMAGISEVWLSLLINKKKQTKDVELARRIEIASQGEFKAVDLIPALKKFVEGK
ncbi:MAG: hypothetical protein ACYDHW_07135 [Syntrophorhabdaceae bacterium]